MQFSHADTSTDAATVAFPPLRMPAAEGAFAEFVLSELAAWQAKGERVALVTVIQIDGVAPRPLGAQMAVSESGAWAGYISGGCLEQALVVEAQRAIREGRNRIVRYGEGSPYFDIRLPCGSGIELYIEQGLSPALVQEANALAVQRTPFLWRADMESGRSEIVALSNGNADATTERRGHLFAKIYQPQVRALVIGAGPIAICTARMASEAGLAVEFHTPESELAASLVPGAVRLNPMNGVPPQIETDDWTGILLSFHDHDLEIPLLTRLLEAPGFFIAAVGSKKAHEHRREVLLAHGMSEAAIARIHSPAGLLKGVKSAPVLALSMLAQLLSEAQARGYV